MQKSASAAMGKCSGVMIIAARRRLLAAARDPDADDLPAVATSERYDNLATIDTVTTPDDWSTGWIGKHLDRRRASSWAAKIEAVKLGDEIA